jgi:CRISPR-associated protein Cmr6
MTDIRRQKVNIQELFTHIPNASLIYDKYMKSFESRDKNAVIEQTKQSCQASDIYRDYFDRWCAAMHRAQIHVHTYETTSRLIIGIGDASVRDIGIRLNPTFGVPYIPGSSLKGIVSSYIVGLSDPHWSESSENYRNLFGAQELAGGVGFFDAMWDPNSINNNPSHQSPLEIDVINPHHQKYYNPTSNYSPDDFEGPIPNLFLTVKHKQRFVVPIFGDMAWTNVAFNMLTRALEEHGIGAKTNAGYGRMHFVAER